MKNCDFKEKEEIHLKKKVLRVIHLKASYFKLICKTFSLLVAKPFLSQRRPENEFNNHRKIKNASESDFQKF